jgi:hypothetical protein
MSVEEWTLIISAIAAIAAVVSAGVSIYLVRQRPQIKVDWPEQPIDYAKRGGPPTYAERFDGTLTVLCEAGWSIRARPRQMA